MDIDPNQVILEMNQRYARDLADRIHMEAIQGAAIRALEARIKELEEKQENKDA